MSDVGEIHVRVTPRASRARIEPDGAGWRAWVTVPPEGGRANAAVQRLLAKRLGVAPSRVVLVAGARSRDKRFRIVP